MKMRNFIVSTLICSRLLLPQACQRSQKRFRYKKKWAVNLGKRDPAKIALHHFDLYYAPIYKHLWPSIRVSLLSMQKYGAVLNNRSHRGDHHTPSFMAELMDVVKLAQQVPIREYAKKFNIAHLTNETNSVSMYGDNGSFSEHHEKLVTSDNDEDSFYSERELQASSAVSRDHQDLHSFMPVTRVYSDREMDEMEEVQQSSYRPRDIPADLVPDTDFSLPMELHVGVFPPAVIRDFPAPRVDPSGLLPYYLMDASSLLPVIALGIQRDDSILDLCAAPGGKALLMLQTLLTENLTCNDPSYSRLGRLFDVMHSYLPSVPPSFNVTQRNGALLREPICEKVLVDAPCNTDRHVLTVQDQNLFAPSRFKERMKIPELQKNLLLAGIRSCVPGGTVVYSTCTLSPVQNDGTVQAVIEDLWKNTNIDVSIVDTSWVAEKFRKTFRFHKHCRFGQLVVPTLTNNFGPTYFCKIKRVK